MSDRSSLGAGPLPVAELVFAPWYPMVTAATRANGRITEGFGTLFSEWQGFLGHCLEENRALYSKLAKVSSPQQAVSAYADYWQKISEDCAQEYATTGKLMTAIAGKVFADALGASHSGRIAPPAHAS